MSVNSEILLFKASRSDFARLVAGQPTLDYVILQIGYRLGSESLSPSAIAHETPPTLIQNIVASRALESPLEFPRSTWHLRTGKNRSTAYSDRLVPRSMSVGMD
jgi:hypothetical protein